MRNLIAFLLRYQGVMLFVLLEIVSMYLFVTNSSYQRATFFNSANAYMGVVLARRKEITDYFRLTDLNKQLLTENAQLRQRLFPPDFARREADSLPVGRDTLGHVVYRHLRPLPGSAAALGTWPIAPAGGATAKLVPLSRRPDTLLLGGVRLATQPPVNYPLIPARVINNSLHNVDNYLTLNVGSLNGVKHGMGVISAAGVVGRVKNVSEHYTTVTSVLHSGTEIAARIKRDNSVGAVRWLGDDFSHALLDQIPRQTRVVRGDTVVTSGFNAVYPGGVFIGVVESVEKEPDKAFLTVTLRLGTDFSHLTYVYVVQNRLAPERQALEDSLATPAATAKPAAPAKPVVAPNRPPQ